MTPEQQQPQQQRRRRCHARCISYTVAALAMCGGFMGQGAEAFLSPAAGRLPFGVSTTSRAAVAAVGAGPASRARASSAVATRRGGGVLMSAVQGKVIEMYMPALSSTMEEGTIVQWLKEVGDKIEVGDPVMVVESDKADMDVESFEEGYLAAVLTEEGASAKVGAAVALIVESEEDIAAAQAAGPSAAGGAPAAVEPVAAPAGGGGAAKPDVPFKEIGMPALSSTMTEGKVVSWLKAEGDKVEMGEAVLVVESDKADMDVESYDEGYLAAIITDEDDSQSVGGPIGLLVDSESDIPAVQEYAKALKSGGGAAPSSPPPAAEAASATAAGAVPTPAAPTSDGGRVVASGLAKKTAGAKGIDLSALAGTGPGGRVVARDVEAGAKGGAPAAPAKPSWTPGPGVVAATPTARALAKKKGVNLSNVSGTGNFGRVTEADVLAFLGEAPKGGLGAAAGADEGLAMREAPDLPDGPKAMDGMQKAVAKNMEATMDVPVFRVSRKIRTDAFDDMYRQLKPKGVTVSAMLAKACALVLEDFPVVNARYEPGQTVYQKDINVAMAVAIDGGLITPTLKNANMMSLLGLSKQWKELVGKAKAKQLKPDEYTGGTFTITNLGMFGVSDFAAILPTKMGAILAIGGSLPTVVQKEDGSFGVVKEMTVTITCDHRHIYGADAALFLAGLADLMENNPLQLLV
eukprot:g5841.t1